MSKLLILTEGGEGIGFGHISRCLAITKYCNENHLETRLWVDWKGELPLPGIFDIVNWSDMRNVVTLDEDYEIVLIDSYLAPLEYFIFLKSKFKKVLVLDDYKRLDDYGADMIINCNVYGDQMSYASYSVGGVAYVILRESFVNARMTHLVNDVVRSVLVTLGGTDFRNLLPLIAAGIDGNEIQYRFVCGNDEYAAMLSKQFREKKQCIFFGLLTEEQMKEEMVKADIAITACGQTLNELVCLGVPTIGICLDHDQIPNMNYYYNNGLLLQKIFWNEDNITVLLSCAVSKYDYNYRQNFFSKAATFRLGFGVSNIYKLLSLNRN